jgi:hypothetical protein
MDNYPSMPVTNGCQKRHTTGQNGAFLTWARSFGLDIFIACRML